MSKRVKRYIVTQLKENYNIRAIMQHKPWTGVLIKAYLDLFIEALPPGVLPAKENDDGDH